MKKMHSYIHLVTILILLSLSHVSAARAEGVHVDNRDSVSKTIEVSDSLSAKLLRKARNYRRAGFIMVPSGLSIAGGSATMAVLSNFGGPQPGATTLFSTFGLCGLGASFSSIALFSKSKRLREQSGKYYYTGGEFRVSFGYHHYFEKEWWHKRDVFDEHPGDHPSHSSHLYSKTMTPRPNLTMDMGFRSKRGIYIGLYGQVLYSGGMFVANYEWELTSQIRLSAGMKGGYLQEEWPVRETYHKQYGGPEFRASFGTGKVRAVVEGQLWFDRVMQFEYIDHSYFADPDEKHKRMGYAPTGFKSGVSPAISLKLQLSSLLQKKKPE